MFSIAFFGLCRGRPVVLLHKLANLVSLVKSFDKVGNWFATNAEF